MILMTSNCEPSFEALSRPILPFEIFNSPGTFFPCKSNPYLQFSCTTPLLIDCYELVHFKLVVRAELGWSEQHQSSWCFRVV